MHTLTPAQRLRRSFRPPLARLALVAATLAGGYVSVISATSPSAADGAEPLLRSWQLQLGGRYARVVETRDSAPVTTWPAAGLKNTSGGQPAPAYADVQRVSASADWVYVESTGLASHQMGPWYWNVETLFGNWAAATGSIFRLPRRTATLDDDKRVATGLGPQGVWVNGVAFFNMLDAAYYNTEAGREIQGDPTYGAADDTSKIWIRDAVPVEGPTFDASNAHQPPVGIYHYHSNPLALRFQLGDNVVWDAAAGRYVERSGAKTHSPLLGWARDGSPIYGPYGYADCSGSAAAVTRMRAGYQLRDGRNGSTDLRVAGRKSLGKWAVQVHRFEQPRFDGHGRMALPASAWGPDVSPAYYLGRYNEDHEFLGDLGQAQGKTYDLDRHNGRFCRTPDFPQGVYAYHVTIHEDGSAAYPYTIGRQFHGDPRGGRVQAISEPVTEQAVAAPRGGYRLTVQAGPAGRQVSWNSAEGSDYRLEASTDGGATWSLVADRVPAASPRGDNQPGGQGAYALEALRAQASDATRYGTEPRYRVTQLGQARHVAGPILQHKGRVVRLSPSTASPGAQIRLTVELDGNQPITDFEPRSSVPIKSLEIVSLDGKTVLASGANFSRQLTLNQADIRIPADVPPGRYMARLVVGPQTYQSVQQTLGVPPERVAPGAQTYPDLVFEVR